jgi:hypothetical protein
MRDIYTRPHRNSIYDPASIHDIPFEVLRESFLRLLKEFGSDLASPSLACRAWRVVALGLMNSRKIYLEGRGRIDSFISGLHLRSTVGLERCTITHIILDLEFVAKEYFDIIARFISLSLSSLVFWFEDREDQSSVCYEALDVFFTQCDGIRNLRLQYFDFGDDPIAISQAVKGGFGRLRQLDLVECLGDIRMFVEITPIPYLELLYYESAREAGEDVFVLLSHSDQCYTICQV